jgi:hypothetical protein
MLFEETVAVYCGDHTNTLCGAECIFECWSRWYI